MQSLALTGPQKAVLMLLSLDEATATPILAEMDAADVKKLRDAAAGLRAVPTTALDGLYAEFIDRSKSAVAVPVVVASWASAQGATSTTAASAAKAATT